MKDLAGKTAFITGGASGIGLGVATRLAQAGVKLMLCDIEKAPLDKAVADLKRANAEVEGVLADVSLKPELQAAAEATLARYGEVHIVHNNAGVGGGGGYGAWTDDAWAWTIGVNLMGVIWGVEIFGPLIERHGQGGHIVNTSSAGGVIPGGGSAYSVTKHAVVALSEGLRRDLAPRGIGVSVLCPGAIRTNMLNSIRNLPDRFAGAAPSYATAGARGSAEIPAWARNVPERIAHGIDPLYVGDLVREAIEEDWPYIFTDLEFEPYVDSRFAGIKAGFDKIRARTPRR